MSPLTPPCAPPIRRGLAVFPMHTVSVRASLCVMCMLKCRICMQGDTATTVITCEGRVNLVGLVACTADGAVGGCGSRCGESRGSWPLGSSFVRTIRTDHVDIVCGVVLHAHSRIRWRRSPHRRMYQSSACSPRKASLWRLAPGSSAGWHADWISFARELRVRGR